MKLFLGCGPNSNWHDKGYKNVDIVDTPNVDYCIDVGEKLPFEDNSIDEIYAESVLEHIGHMLPRFTQGDKQMLNTKYVLKDWRRVLKIGGKLIIKVPNLECQFNKYTIGINTLKEILVFIYGGTVHKENAHLAGFDKVLMEECLKDAGFTQFEFHNGQYIDQPLSRKGNDEMIVITTK